MVLFYGSIKLSGYKKDVTGDGKADNYGGNRCEGLKDSKLTWRGGQILKTTVGISRSS